MTTLLPIAYVMAGIGVVMYLLWHFLTNMKAFRPLTPIVGFMLVFVLTLCLQGFHWIEHIAQVMQAFVLDSRNAHGLLGQLDLEQVHFAFNTLYLGLVAHITLQWFAHKEEFPSRWKLCAIILIGTLLIQSYHQVEHTVKVFQFVQTMIQGTPGILGHFINGVWFHFWMNALVFWPLVFVYFYGGVHRRLMINLQRVQSEPA